MYNDIKCVRLIAGEEIIGEVKEEGNTINVTDPASIHMIPSPNGQQMSLGLMPWLPYSDNRTFEINKAAVVTIHVPGVDLINNYNRMFGAGIQIANVLPN